MRNKVWHHKKYGKKNFYGRYVRLKGERVFELVNVMNGIEKVVTFESWQAAKALGWTN